MLAPPVPFWDGSIIPVYIFDRGAQIEITDDGGLLRHFEVSGFPIGSDKRKYRGLEAAVSKWNVSLDTELQMWSKPELLGHALQRYLGALFAAAHWESENAGRAIDENLLMAEAEMYLVALHPGVKAEHNVKVAGISGKMRNFPLSLAGTFYDSVGTHPSASAPMVKKLFDVRSVKANSDLPITVIINDIGHEDAARADTHIYTQLAHVQRFSSLRAEAHAVMTQQ